MMRPDPGGFMLAVVIALLTAVAVGVWLFLVVRPAVRGERPADAVPTPIVVTATPPPTVMASTPTRTATSMPPVLIVDPVLAPTATATSPPVPTSSPALVAPAPTDTPKPSVQRG